jgi:integrase/recombinase XerD
MRISEALSLTVKDIDFSQKVISVVNPKNHKDRRLPIDHSLIEYLEWYKMKIYPLYHEDDLFFMSNRGNFLRT